MRDYDAAKRSGLPAKAAVLRPLLDHPKEMLLAMVAASCVSAMCVNALFLQPGPHPAPIFAVTKVRAAPSAPAAYPAAIVAREATGAVALLPRPRPAEAGETKVESPRRAETAARPATGARPQPASRGDPIADIIARSGASDMGGVPAPSRTNVAEPRGPSMQNVQKALREFGYGQIKVSGLYDPDTRAALEQFERQRGLPVTGQASERTVRELEKMVGHTLD